MIVVSDCATVRAKAKEAKHIIFIFLCFGVMSIEHIFIKSPKYQFKKM